MGKKKKKIAYLCSGYPAISHTFILREIKELRKNGFAISTASINSFRSWPEITRHEEREGEKTFCIKEVPKWKIISYYHLLTFLNSPSRYLKALFCSLQLAAVNGPKNPVKAVGYFVEAVVLSRWLQEIGVNHVHVHFPNPAATVVLVATRLYDFEFSISIHGPDEFFGTNENLLIQKIERAKFIRCISHFARSQLMRLVPTDQWEKLRIVRCGIDVEDFPLATEPKNKVPQILCVGRLTKNKGQNILLQACTLLINSQKVKFHLTLIGDGEERIQLEDLAANLGVEKFVTFTGPVGQNKIKEYYRKADLFVLPSFAEGVPVVLMEAMATGIPVISTNIAGIAELVENKSNGLIVAAGDVESLAKKIESLLEGLTVRSIFSQNARKTIEEQHDIGKNCQKLTEIFEEEIA